MGVVIIFLLAVLFVAAVWGREAAQKAFGIGMTVFMALLAVVAVVVTLLVVDFLKWDAEKSRANAPSNAYHVPSVSAPQVRYAAPQAAPAAGAFPPDLGNPKISVRMRSLQPDEGAPYGLPPGYGVVVGVVFPNSVAQTSGLQVGDYITQVDGKWITDVDAINRNNVGKRVGDIIVLRVLRGNQQYLVRVPLGNP